MPGVASTMVSAGPGYADVPSPTDGIATGGSERAYQLASHNPNPGLDFCIFSEGDVPIGLDPEGPAGGRPAPLPPPTPRPKRRDVGGSATTLAGIRARSRALIPAGPAFCKGR